MGRIEVGYNIDGAREVTEEMQEAWKELASKIEDEWNPVKKVLRKEWIGTDEASYEKTLIEKINKLYASSESLARYTAQTMEDLANAWIEFQRTNVIEGKEVGGQKKVEFSAIFPVQGDLISYDEQTFSDGDDMGLNSASSGEAIKGAITEYVEGIKQKAERLFSKIKVKNAFYGDYASEVDKLIEHCGTVIGEVLAAVKDMFSAVDQLVTANYGQASSDAAQMMSEQTSNLDQQIEGLGESRWS